jgi:hypothetical protein
MAASNLMLFAVPLPGAALRRLWSVHGEMRWILLAEDRQGFVVFRLLDQT